MFPKPTARCSEVKTNLSSSISTQEIRTNGATLHACVSTAYGPIDLLSLLFKGPSGTRGRVLSRAHPRYRSWRAPGVHSYMNPNVSI
uniref:Uncharacterized protein n=1 Tax=Rhizophora mucronata TaxID=61149 RepID=A0A2P2QKJ0_RHIMU